MSKRLMGDSEDGKGGQHHHHDHHQPHTSTPPSPYQGTFSGHVSPNQPTLIDTQPSKQIFDVAPSSGSERDGRYKAHQGQSSVNPSSSDFTSEGAVSKRRRLNDPSTSVDPYIDSRVDLASSQNFLGSMQSTISTSTSVSAPTRGSDLHPTPCAPRSAPVRLNVPHVSNDSPTYTTSTGSILHLQNAGFILSHYIQSYGLPPTEFRQKMTFTTIPNGVSKVPNWTPDQHHHQPPPNSWFHCTITLPKPCPVSTVTSPGVGYRSKDLAKKHATMEIVKLLIQAGEITPDLKSRPRERKNKADRKSDRNADLAQHDGGRALAGRDLTQNGSSTAATRPIEPVPKGIAEYPHLPQARFWSTCPPLRPDELYPTVIELMIGGEHSERSKECRKLCLLTSRPLPLFGDTHEYIVDVTQPVIGPKKLKVEAAIKLTQGRRLKTLDEGKLDEIMRYTERLVRALVNKPAEGTLETSRWLLVPLSPEYTVSTKIRRRDIAWDEIELASGPLCVPFSVNDVQKLEQEGADAISTTIREFGRRWYVKTLRYDLSPDSIDPSDPKGEKTIRSGFLDQVELTVQKQPVFQVDVVNGSRHGGFIAGLVTPKLADKYVIPEMAYRHCISASVYKTASALPALLDVVDDLLVALDLSKDVFHGRLDVGIALNAITCPTGHGQNLTKTYQRLEMLGDTLLKLLVSVYLLYRVDGSRFDWDTLHKDREVMLQNRTLQALAIEAGVVPYIRDAVARAKEWIPMGWEAKEPEPTPVIQRQSHEEEGSITKETEGTTQAAHHINDTVGPASSGSDAQLRTSDPYPGAGETANTAESSLPPKAALRGEHLDVPINPTWSKKRPRPDDPSLLRQRLGDKTIADIAESLVAAAYLSEDSNIDAAIFAMHVLKMPLEGFSKWDDVVQHTIRRNQAVKEKHGNGNAITLLGYTFKLAQNGRDALTLSSDHERKSQFTQFKVLGDAVLDYFMVENLFHSYPTEGPGSLTVMRHSRHGDTTLAAFNVISGLIDQVTDVGMDVLNSILKFKKSVNAAQAVADETEAVEEKWEFWADIPSLNSLADVVNAILGAILVDSNYDLSVLREIYTSVLLPFFDAYCVGPGQHGRHPKTVLNEMLSKRGCHKWEIRKEEMINSSEHWSSVWMHEQMIGKGEAETQSLSTRRASEAALKKVKAENLLEKLCTCPKKKKKRDT